jgi:hypothetical protein
MVDDRDVMLIGLGTLLGQHLKKENMTLHTRLVVEQARGEVYYIIKCCSS